MNGLSKLRYAITSIIVNLTFIILKVFYLANVYLNGIGLLFSSLISSYMNLIISENLLTYCQ